MARTQQTIVNGGHELAYVSVEPWPECFELKPADKLTLIWDAGVIGDAVEMKLINGRELVIEPTGALDQMQFLVNGELARHLSWAFRRS